MKDIHLAALQLGKYPHLVTSTSVNDRETVEMITIWFLERISLTSLGNLRFSSHVFQTRLLFRLSESVAKKEDVRSSSQKGQTGLLISRSD